MPNDSAQAWTMLFLTVGLLVVLFYALWRWIAALGISAITGLFLIVVWFLQLPRDYYLKMLLGAIDRNASIIVSGLILTMVLSIGVLVGRRPPRPPSNGTPGS